MRKIDETAAAGSTSAGSIATVPSNRLGGMQTRMSLKDFMMGFYGRMNNRNKFHPVRMEGSISKIEETAAYPYQLDDATSRMKAAQMQGEVEHANRDIDTVTYGVQDDEGSMMTITVPIDQGEDLERHVAQCLADVLDFKKTGHGEDKTLAELLYELKDQFTIINAEFPTIPKDAVYNAEEITEDLPDDPMDTDMGDDMGDDLGDEEMGDDEGNDLDGDMGDLGDDEDADMGMDFDAEGEDDESLLKSVLGMLKTQAERDIAQANAEAEKAKAKQAELALDASTKEMKAQEHMVAAEAEMDAEKEREKQAKKMAELAKHNIKKRRMGEGFSPLFRESIIEALDPNATRASVQRDRMNIQQMMQPDQDATPEEQAHMQKRKQQALRINQIEKQAAQDQQRFNSQQAQKEKEAKQQQDGEENDRSARQPRGPQ